jgi:LuxR family transcriptional regulator of csgAB operon
MNKAFPSKKPFTESKIDTILFIVGPKSLENEMLCEFLTDNTGLTCCCLENQNLESLLDHFPDKKYLILVDYNKITTSDHWNIAKINNIIGHSNSFFICFNMSPDCQIEQYFLMHGIHGILYNDQPISLYPKAIEKVLNNELWFPRKILNSVLLNENPRKTRLQNINVKLTMREKEIFELMASGMSNKEIARKLFISINTVKTHVYKLFKKLNVSNRLQAAMFLENNKSIDNINKITKQATF